MQLQEKVARDLRRSTVVLTTTPARAGGDYGGGLGTVVGDRWLITSFHCVSGPRVYIWHPEDELKQEFSIVRRGHIGENSLVEVNKVLPFPAYPVSRKPLSEVMKPGATIVYPGGYEFYRITGAYSDQMPMNVGIYNGSAGGNEHLAWGRISQGTSGGGVVSLEDQVLVGIIYGMGHFEDYDIPQDMFFRGADNLAPTLDSVGIPEFSEVPAGETALAEQILPEVQNRYFRWGIIGLAGIGGFMIAKSLLE